MELCTCRQCCGSGSGIRCFFDTWIWEVFDPGSGMEKFGSGIWYKHPGSATLLVENNFVTVYLKFKSNVILTSRSEVFAAMLRHEFLEKQNSRVDIKVSAKARLSLQKDKLAE
jgi:hypothetical protein